MKMNSLVTFMFLMVLAAAFAQQQQPNNPSESEVLTPEIDPSGGPLRDENSQLQDPSNPNAYPADESQNLIRNRRTFGSIYISKGYGYHGYGYYRPRYYYSSPYYYSYYRPYYYHHW